MFFDNLLYLFMANGIIGVMITVLDFRFSIQFLLHHGCGPIQFRAPNSPHLPFRISRFLDSACLAHP